MNPDFIFPALDCAGWKYTWIPKEYRNRPWIHCVCTCTIPKNPVLLDSTVAPNVMRVEMLPHRLKHERGTYNIYIGICPACRIAHWTADDFEFLMLMKPAQVLDYALQQCSINHYTVANDVVALIHDKFDVVFLFDNRGFRDLIVRRKP